MVGTGKTNYEIGSLGESCALASVENGLIDMSENPGRVLALFTEALQHLAAERWAFLNRACAGDDELRRKVEALLRAHEQLGNFMETPNSSAGSPDMLDPTIDEEPSEPGAKNGESTGK